MPNKEKSKGMIDSVSDMAKSVNSSISKTIRKYEAWKSKDMDRADAVRAARLTKEYQQEAAANKARGTQSSSTRKIIK